ncbi:DUF6531 domain-containing protein [Methyloglobulus morosus]|nr:DUF6531 domain-containing protein [Methyloglobulus morosus]
MALNAYPPNLDTKIVYESQIRRFFLNSSGQSTGDFWRLFPDSDCPLPKILTTYRNNNYCVDPCPQGQVVNATNPTLCTNLATIKNNGKKCPSAGNPINVGNGNKFQIERDYLGAGNIPLYIERTYNSDPSTSVTFGTSSGWHHTYDRSIGNAIGSNLAVAYRADGSAFKFILVGSNWQPDSDINYHLQEILSGITRTGWKVTTPDNTVETYSAVGVLLDITELSSHIQTLSYSCKTVSSACPVTTPTTVAPYAGLLIKVTDNFGNSLNFTYNSLGQMVTLTDPIGNVTRYGYDGNGNLATITYPDDTPSVSTDNPVKTYVYGELANTANVSQPNALTGIIDENGVRYATYKYDANGKAISTEHAGSVEKYALNYAPDGTSTAVTDPLGAIRTTHFTTVLGVVKSTGTDQPGGSGCSAASSAMTYDANGNVASRTDFNGHKVCYAYDLSRNLETARVEGLASVADCTVNLAASSLPAPARKVSTQWHGTYRLPLQVAEPKRLATYTYDATGNVLSRTEQATTDPAGVVGLTPTVTGTARTWGYTYNNFGQVLTADGPRTDVSDVTATTYYPVADPVLGNRGNPKDVTNALGQKTTFDSYDGNGRLTQTTAPNGVVTTLAYTPRGWLKTLTTRDSASTLVQTTSYGYDPTGLLKTVTAPDTSVLTYGYDNAHRLVSVTDSLGNKVSYTLDNLGNRTNETATDPGNVLRRNIARAYDALGRLQTVTGGVQ